MFISSNVKWWQLIYEKKIKHKHKQILYFKSDSRQFWRKIWRISRARPCIAKWNWNRVWMIANELVKYIDWLPRVCCLCAHNAIMSSRYSPISQHIFKYTWWESIVKYWMPKQKVPTPRQLTHIRLSLTMCHWIHCLTYVIVNWRMNLKIMVNTCPYCRACPTMACGSENGLVEVKTAKNESMNAICAVCCVPIKSSAKSIFVVNMLSIRLHAHAAAN